MHDSSITTAHDTAPANLTLVSAQRYRIGVLLTDSETEVGSGHLEFAAERLGHSILRAQDAAEFGRSTVDFAIAKVNLKEKPNAVPTFGLVRDAKIGFCDDDEWLSRVAKFDGYLTISDAVRRFVAGFGSQRGTEPLIGFFEFTPERQFLTCQLERLIGSSAFRLCDISREPQKGLISGLATRPYLRRYAMAPNDAGAVGLRLIGAQSAQRVFAAFGGGLIMLEPEQEMDAAVLHRLCEIVSVGAVAICPDVPWIRRYFGNTIWYYPVGDSSTSFEAIDGAVQAITGDPAGAAARARAAKSLFDETFAAEIMLQNATRLFEDWRQHALRPVAPEGREKAGTGLNRRAFARPKLHADCPLVSLIITVKNGMPFIRRAIESVRGQLYPNLELVVQDCMSEDGSSELLTEIGDIDVDLAREPDGGIGDAVARALSRCRGPIVGSLDSDNLLSPGALHRVAKHFAQSPGDAAAYGAVEMIDETGARLEVFRPGRFNFLRVLECELVPPWSTAFFRRKTLVEAFQPGASLRTCADFSMWLHLGHLPIGYIDEPLGSTRLSRNSMTCNVDAYEQFCADKIKALEQYLASCRQTSLCAALLVHGKVGIYCWAAQSITSLDRSRRDLIQSFLGRARAIAPASSRLATAIERIDAFNLSASRKIGPDPI